MGVTIVHQLKPSPALSFCSTFLALLIASTFPVSKIQAQLRPSQQTAIEDVEKRTRELKQVNESIWNFAEVGLKEIESSALLVEKLKSNGFQVKTGISGMPTALVASYGKGKPVIGILAEYDALPGMSQQVAPERIALKEGEAGHACGHSGLGAGALGAAGSHPRARAERVLVDVRHSVGPSNRWRYC